MVNYTYASITIFIDGLEVSFYLFSTKASNNMKLAAHMAHSLHVVVVVFTLKAVPISTQYFLTSVLVQLTRTPSVVTG